MNPVVVILEGADGAGKSHLAERIRRAAVNHVGAVSYGVSVQHNGPTPELSGRQLYRRYKSQIDWAVGYRDQGGSTVIDRSFLSEGIYGRIFRRSSRLTDRQLRRLERYALDNGVKLVGVHTHRTVREATIRGRGEAWDVRQNVVSGRYLKHFQEHHWITVGRDAPLSTILN